MAGEGDSLLGRVLGGRYRVERLLERGGMGAIYEAVQQPLGRRVALKVLHSHLSDDPVILERFRREAEASARLHHPHVVQVTDYQAQPGEEAFLVMELVEGRPLAEVMRSDGILPPTRAVHIAVQLLDALGAAHAEGIVHRDLKPTNVLLSSSAAVEDVVTVLDFGIAKLADPTGNEPRKLTKEGMLVGTPAYMAPEQARGEEVDERADLYGAGVLLYAMLAGRLPYPQKDRGEVLRALLNEDPPTLVEVRPDVDPDLGGIVDRALAKDPSERWQTADEMRRALFRWQRRMGVGDPTSAPPPPPSTPASDSSAPEPGGPRVSMRTWVFVAGIAASAVLGALVARWAYDPGARDDAPTTEAAVAAPLGDGADRERAAAPPDTGAGAVAPSAPSEAAPPEPAADPGAPAAVQAPPAAARPAVRRPPEPRGQRLRLMGSAGDRLYDAETLEPRLAALSGDLSRCAEGRDVPEGAAPPVWYVGITADGSVRSVRTTMGEWPIAVANCVTRALRDVELGPTATGDGGQLVLSVSVD